MRTCDSVIRKCVVGGKSSTESSGERYTLRYLYNDGTRPETRKRRQKCAGLCEVGPKQGAIEQFFDLGFPATVKT